MPTGYTAKLVESGQTFQEFVMTCARAFGACVEMRDESMDAPIPDEFKADDYHKDRITSAKLEAERLSGMDKKARASFGEDRKKESLKSHQAWLAKEIMQDKRLDEMLVLVHEWTPPTHDHSGLKTFMLEQLSISKNGTKYIEELIAKTEAKSEMDFYNEALDAAKRDIDYHTEEQSKSVKRASSRTDWVKQLRNSIQ